MGRGPARKGDLVAHGSTADIYAWGRAAVVKVLRPGIPDGWAAREAEVTAAVHRAGLPAPATDGVVDVDGRPGIVFERIAGVSLWERMRADPAEIEPVTRRFAAIQGELLAAGPVPGLPPLADRLAEKIADAGPVDAATRREAGDLLARLPVGAAPCHGDLHPGNVLVAGDRLVVIDWHDGVAGHPFADLARTSLLLDPAFHAGRLFLHGATGPILARVHSAYHEAIGGSGGPDDGSMRAWRAVQAIARLAEPGTPASLIGAWEAWRTATPA